MVVGASLPILPRWPAVSKGAVGKRNLPAVAGRVRVFSLDALGSPVAGSQRVAVPLFGKDLRDGSRRSLLAES